MKAITYASLCTGIEGMGLGADWLGWQPVFQVEIDPFCQAVLNRNYPSVPKYRDVKTFNGKPYRNTVDVIFFGFPCQPYSVAGRRMGDQDPRAIRHQCVRIVREVNPKFIVAENVAGILSQSAGLVFEDFCAELEAAGYEVQPLNLPAAGVGACHKRERIFFIAKNTHRYLNGERQAGWRIGEHGNARSAVQVWDATNNAKSSNTNGCRDRSESEYLSAEGQPLRRPQREEKNNVYQHDAIPCATNTNEQRLQAWGKPNHAAHTAENGTGVSDRAKRSNTDTISATNTDRERELQLQGGECDKWGWIDNPLKEKLTYDKGSRLQSSTIRQAQVELGRNHTRRADIQDYWPTVAARVHGVDDDLPRWLDVAQLRVDIKRVCPQANEAAIKKAIIKTVGRIREERIKACGNGVVAELSYRICKAIEAVIW
jgi:DNA-cytosine methyltransferase